MEKVKLFCIPYSGGSSSIYFKWKRLLNENIDLRPVETAGRGRRMKTSFYKDIAAAADDISNIILSELGEEPYAIYGHSLGSLLAFETYYCLKKKGAHEPIHIFFSGRKAPNEMGDKTEFYKLPERRFLEVLFEYGKSNYELMQSRELLDIFIPILRADYRIAETYEYAEHKMKIMCDFTVVNGKNDFSIMKSDMNMWKSFAGKNYTITYINGEHFFITDNCKDTVDLINSVLSRPQIQKVAQGVLGRETVTTTSL